MGEWPVVAVLDACESIVDCVNKTAPTVPYSTPFRMIRTTNVKSGRLNLEDAKHVTPDVFSIWTRRAVPTRGDVILTREAPLGEVALVRDEQGIFLGQRLVQYRANRKKLVPEFLFYAFQSPFVQGQIHAHGGTGSTVDHIRVPDCQKFRVPLPPLSEQRAIAHVLGTLDDKIELNRKMIQTLEEMARALFKSWFVDFDPVRAKAAGKKPHGMDDATAALFPDSFEQSELGEIPKGWRVVSIEQVADVRGGKQLPTEQRGEQGRYPVFGANGMMGRCELATHEGFVIAFGRVGAYCGSIHWAYGGAWINNNASAVVPKNFDEFVLQSMLGIDFPSMRTGSAQPFIPNSAVAAAPLVCAPDEVLAALCRQVRPLRMKQVAAERESTVVAGLRDTLLPHLLSGELSVAQAERAVEATA